MKRRQWFELHSWAGLQVSLLLCVVLITGTLATVSRDIDWLFNPALRASPAERSSPAPWSQYLWQAQSVQGERRIDSLFLPAESWLNAEAILVDPQGDRSRVYLDPTRGFVTGVGAWNNWQRFFRQLHRHLMMPISLGLTLVCLTCIPLLVSLISSLKIYKGWYRKFFALPKLRLDPQKSSRRKDADRKNKHRQARQFWGELHRFVGIWTLWFMLLIVITGVWYFLEHWGLKAESPADVPQGHVLAPYTELSPERLDELLAIAKAEYPELSIREILLPGPDEPLIRFRGQAQAVLVRDRANQVVLEAETGAVMAVHNGEVLDVHSRISEAADPLHFGSFAGWISRWLWFIFGVFLSGLALSGVYLQVLRITKARDSMSSGRAFLQAGWQGMAFLRWPVAVILGVALALSIQLFLPLP